MLWMKCQSIDFDHQKHLMRLQFGTGDDDTLTAFYIDLLIFKYFKLLKIP
jgi:hypothetical protein